MTKFFVCGDILSFMVQVVGKYFETLKKKKRIEACLQTFELTIYYLLIRWSNDRPTKC